MLTQRPGHYFGFISTLKLLPHPLRLRPTYRGLLILFTLLLPSVPAAAQEDPSLRIVSKPVGDVYLNGHFVGRTPLVVTPSRDTGLEVEIRAEGYVPWRRSMAASGRPDMVSATLEPGKGTVRLLNVPAGTLVRLGDRKLNDYTSGFEVAGPSQVLRVRLPNGRIARQQVAPLHAREREIMLVQQVNYDVLARSLLVPGWGQAYDGHRIEGAAFLLVGAGTAAFLVYSDWKFRRSVTAYRSARNAYEAAVIESDIVQLRDEMLRQHAVTLRNNSRREIALAGFIAAYAANAVGTLILHTVGYGLEPASQRGASTLRMSSSATGNMMSIRVTVTL